MDGTAEVSGAHPALGATGPAVGTAITTAKPGVDGRVPSFYSGHGRGRTGVPPRNTFRTVETGSPWVGWTFSEGVVGLEETPTSPRATRRRDPVRTKSRTSPWTPSSFRRIQDPVATAHDCVPSVLSLTASVSAPRRDGW